MYVIFYLGISPNHFITSCVFFQCLYFVLSFTTLSIFSNNCLLVLPISGLQGFIRRHVGLFLKFSLCMYVYIYIYIYIYIYSYVIYNNMKRKGAQQCGASV